MIHFIVATPSEARPLIEFFKLKKKDSISNFIFFVNDDISLTISGIGKLNSAMSVAHTFCEFNKVKNNIWINFGISGHINHNIGKVFLINKIIDKETNYKFFPHIIKNCNLNQHSCMTYSKESFAYTDDLSDMEAFGFFMGAEKYSTRELIHTIKIISDNKDKKIDFLDKNKVYEIIKPRLKQLSEYKDGVFKIWKEFYLSKRVIDEKIKKIIKNKKLSFYQKKEFTKVLEIYFLNIDRNAGQVINFSDNLVEEIKSIKRKLKYEF